MKRLVALASVIAFALHAAAAVAQSSNPEAFESPVSTQELSESTITADDSATAPSGVPSPSSAASAVRNTVAPARDSLKIRNEVSINPIQDSRR